MSLFILKNRVASMANRVSNLDARISARSDLRVILAYHRVLPRAYLSRHRLQSAMWVSDDTFEAQLRWFQSVGRIVSLKEILDFSGPQERPLFCVTFDDGWFDNYEHAFPIMRKLNVPATIFLATEAIETGRAFWAEELIGWCQHALSEGRTDSLIAVLNEHMPVRLDGLASTAALWMHVDQWIERIKLLKDGERQALLAQVKARLVDSTGMPIMRSMMTWEQVREMSENGIDFQSHTHSHRILKYLNDAEIASELEQSKELLEQNLLKPITVFCYPNARYPIEDKSSLYRSSGYEFGVKIDNQFLARGFHPFFVPRLLMNEDNSGNPGYLKFRLLGVPKY